MDYERLGLKVGLELHQQLNTRKLFCRCSSEMREEEIIFNVKRRLRPVMSELGDVDRAALFEFFRDREFVYHGYKGEACLVELDEEPPHEINREALEIALQISMMLGLRIPDELHVMRKIVLDGSAITSFQRTVLVGYGAAEFEGVRITSLYLEEDACKIENVLNGRVIYSLSRLGIPLIEIDTTPEITTPEQAKRVAGDLGLLLRSFNVKRGIGTIRQDVNVSIKGGARVEIKGWQDLRRLDKLVENEVLRQVNLIEIRDELRKKYKELEIKVKQLERDSWLIAIPHAAKVFEREICRGKTLLQEIMDYAAAYGAKVESNEGSSGIEIKIFGRHASEAARCVAERVKLLTRGVPAETRAIDNDVTTKFSRPLPGSARMYPETDHPPIALAGETLESLKRSMPLNLLEMKHSLYNSLPSELVEQISQSKYFRFFIEIKDSIKKENLVTVASTLTNTLKDLKRRGIAVEKLTAQHLREVFSAFDKGIISKQSIPEILEEVIEGNDVKLAIHRHKMLDKEEVRKILREAVEKNKGKDLRAIVAMVMSKLRGRVDGKFVVEELKKLMKR